MLRGMAVARRTLCANGSSSSVVGLGYVSREITGVSRSNLMREMMSSIDHPSSTIRGVTSVLVQPALGDAGFEGALWRKMVVDGTTHVEHVYANPAIGVIKRVPLEADGKTEGKVEHVTQLSAKPELHIELFSRETMSLQRVQSCMPLAAADFAVEQTVALARAKEAQETDCNFHTAKA